MKKRSPAAQTLTDALKPWFEKSLAELPANLRKRVQENILLSWDGLTSQERQQLASYADTESLAPQDEFAHAFQAELIQPAGGQEIARRKAVALTRNRRAAKRPRPAKQKLPANYLAELVKQYTDAKKNPRDMVSWIRKKLASEGTQITVTGIRKQLNPPVRAARNRFRLP